MAVQRSLAILAILILTGGGGEPHFLSGQARNDYKGKPLNAVTAQLGYPDFQETIGGQKSYVWRRGTAMQECRIRVVMAGDVVAPYDTSGDAPICSPYLAPAQPVSAQ